MPACTLPPGALYPSWAGVAASARGASASTATAATTATKTRERRYTPTPPILIRIATKVHGAGARSAAQIARLSEDLLVGLVDAERLPPAHAIERLPREVVVRVEGKRPLEVAEAAGPIAELGGDQSKFEGGVLAAGVPLDRGLESGLGALEVPDAHRDAA